LLNDVISRSKPHSASFWPGWAASPRAGASHWDAAADPLDALNLLYLLAQFRIPPYIVFGDDEFRLGLNYLALATA
jgi:hypothetical protein